MNEILYYNSIWDQTSRNQIMYQSSLVPRTYDLVQPASQVYLSQPAAAQGRKQPSQRGFRWRQRLALNKKKSLTRHACTEIDSL